MEGSDRASAHGEVLRIWSDILGGRLTVADRGWNEDSRTISLVRHSNARPLTRTERSVLILVSCGVSNQDAGELLNCRSSTIATHLATVSDKLSARRLDLVAFGPLLEPLMEGR